MVGGPVSEKQTGSYLPQVYETGFAPYNEVGTRWRSAHAPDVLGGERSGDYGFFVPMPCVDKTTVFLCGDKTCISHSEDAAIDTIVRFIFSNFGTWCQDKGKDVGWSRERVQRYLYVKCGSISPYIDNIRS